MMFDLGATPETEMPYSIAAGQETQRAQPFK
jgi:hypothetical protein